MARITILDPTAAPPDVDADPGPDAGSLAGQTVGLRWDSPWRSWQWVIDEWAPALEDVGANVRTWLAGGREVVPHWWSATARRKPAGGSEASHDRERRPWCVGPP